MRALQPPFLKAAVGVIRAGRDEVATTRLLVRQTLLFAVIFTALAIIMVASYALRPPKDGFLWLTFGAQIFFAATQWVGFFVYRRKLAMRSTA